MVFVLKMFILRAKEIEKCKIHVERNEQLQKEIQTLKETIQKHEINLSNCKETMKNSLE